MTLMEVAWFNRDAHLQVAWIMSQPDPEELLSLDEIEAEFGVDRSTIYRRRKAGEIKQFKKVGDRRAYYRRSDLEELLKPRVVEDEQ